MSDQSIRRVFIANRGEIAVRIIRACQGLGLETVVAVSAADRDSLAARLADRAICIGPAKASQSYLVAERLLAAALGTGCDAIHPGYGLLSESPEFAEKCDQEGIIFVGPTSEQIHQMGNKLSARALARQAGVPMLPGSQKVDSAQDAEALAAEIGYPVMLKAAAGGGGRGMKIVNSSRELALAFATASGEARSAFGDGSLYLERYLINARHVEVQILGDVHGNVVHVGDRDCSLQRRHQKLVEEALAPGIPEATRDEMYRTSIALTQELGYRGAGTVEFILDQDTQEFFFLEMNTRIQVEHPVSEAISGIDLVEQQLRVARGEALRFTQSEIGFRGHAIECRINAESPLDEFRPTPGRITRWEPPQGPNIRVETHCFEGYSVPPYYDSLLAKLVVVGWDREDAIFRMRRALERFEVGGVSTTIDFLKTVMDSDVFARGTVNTRSLDGLIAEFADRQPRDRGYPSAPVPNLESDLGCGREAGPVHTAG